MKNINKKLNKSVFGFGLLAIMGLTFIAIPTSAQAYDELYGGGYFNKRPAHNNESYIPRDNSNDPEYMRGANTDSNSIGPVSTSNTTTETKSTTTKKTTTSKPATTTTTTTTEEPNDEVSTLAGNAIFGSNGFLPSGLIQWTIIAILILVAVIIIRKITGAEDRYHGQPMKHA